MAVPGVYSSARHLPILGCQASAQLEMKVVASARAGLTFPWCCWRRENSYPGQDTAATRYQLLHLRPASGQPQQGFNTRSHHNHWITRWLLSPSTSSDHLKWNSLQGLWPCQLEASFFIVILCKVRTDKIFHSLSIVMGIWNKEYIKIPEFRTVCLLCN